MAFIKYDSIDNHYQSVAVERFAQIVPPNEMCFLKEKVHGSNLQIIIDADGNVLPAKRSGLVEPDESFYDVFNLIERLKPKFLEAYQLVQKLDQTSIRIPPVISICGEIFGGTYPGVDQIKPTKSVQKGVYYAPDIHFYAFDIRLLFDQSEIEFDKRPPQPYLPWSVAEKILDQAGIFRAEVLGKMKAREVVKLLQTHNCIPEFPAKFQTTIPKRLGLPPIADNWAEGYVICPDQTYFSNGGSRQIFKYKNDSFAESVPTKTPKPKTVDPAFQEIWESVEDTFLVADYMKNRLDNVLSHEGLELTDNKMRGKIVKLFLTDLVEEVEKIYPNLTKEHKKELIKKLGSRCGPFVQKCVAQPS